MGLARGGHLGETKSKQSWMLEHLKSGRIKMALVMNRNAMESQSEFSR